MKNRKDSRHTKKVLNPKDDSKGDSATTELLKLNYSGEDL
jgi:hypothetical protein